MEERDSYPKNVEEAADHAADGGKNLFHHLKDRQQKITQNVHWTSVLFWSIIGLFVAIFIAMTVFGVGIYKFHWDNKATQIAYKIVPYPAAVVDFDSISVADFYHELGYINHFYQESKQAPPPEKQLRQNVLNQLIEQKVLDHQAKKYHISVSSEEVDQQYQKLAEEQGGLEQVKKILADLWGLDENQFKQLIKDQLIREKLKEEIPVQVDAKMVLIKVPKDADQATKDAAKAKAEDLRNQIKNGAKFEDIAKAQSQDETSKDKGGDLGWITYGSSGSDTFDKNVLSLKKDDLSEVFYTPEYGYHIVMVTDRKGKVAMSFSDWLKDVESKSRIWRFLS